MNSSHSSKDLNSVFKLNVQELDEIAFGKTMNSFLNESLQIMDLYKVGISEHLLVLDKNGCEKKKEVWSENSQRLRRDDSEAQFFGDT